MMSEGHHGATGSEDPRADRARSQVAGARAIAERGRPAEAERRLRDALGVLERRRRYAGAARAAATLGWLLRERGELSRAESTLERARVLFDVAVSTTAWSEWITTKAEAARQPGIGHPEEREDFVHAYALLSDETHAGAARPDPRPVPPAAEGVAPLADEAVELLRSQIHEEGLEPLCARVKRSLDASAVAVFPLMTGSTPLMVVGSLPRAVARRVQEMALTGQVGSMLDREGAAEAAVQIRIGDQDDALARLVVCWSRSPAAAVRPGVEHLLRVAAVLSVPIVRLALDRQMTQSNGQSSGLLGTSRQMRDLRASVAEQAACPFPILIEGETGTGKEVVARGLHENSPRRRAAFCAVNCAALTDELFEAELFGHARGAFTGAVTQRAGLFEAAHRGTLFLDEVGELSARAQAKLLRVVQEGEVRRVGENAPRRVDVRIIAATNRVLTSEVAAGRFRQDLLFRLAVVRLRVPPLRTRGEDIPLLARHFWMRALAQTGGHAALSGDTLAALVRHSWPGNVRELENVMSALAVRAPRRGWARSSLLPEELQDVASSKGTTLAAARRAFERGFVRAALGRAGGRPGLAAKEIGLSRQGLAKMMTRLDLGRDG